MFHDGAEEQDEAPAELSQTAQTLAQQTGYSNNQHILFVNENADMCQFDGSLPPNEGKCPL